ncbi:hypothetical protein ACET3Z_028242 [Daucus carota]
MDGAKRETSTVPSLPPPLPKSPPPYPDLYGKRRELARVQMLEREIGFLEEELKTVGRIQPASRSCKEVTDFVMANSDPLVTKSRKIRKSRRFWKWLCGKSCFNLSWMCCCCGCCPRLRRPDCCSCSCDICNCNPCACCSIPKGRAAIVANAKALLAQIARAPALVLATSAAHAVVHLDVRRSLLDNLTHSSIEPACWIEGGGVEVYRRWRTYCQDRAAGWLSLTMLTMSVIMYGEIESAMDLVRQLDARMPSSFVPEFRQLAPKFVDRYSRFMKTVKGPGFTPLVFEHLDRADLSGTGLAGVAEQDIIPMTQPSQHIPEQPASSSRPDKLALVSLRKGKWKMNKPLSPTKQDTIATEWGWKDGVVKLHGGGGGVKNALYELKPVNLLTLAPGSWIDDRIIYAYMVRS